MTYLGSARWYLLVGAAIGLLIPIAAYVQAEIFGGIGDATLILWPGGRLTTGLHARTPGRVVALVVSIAIVSNVVLYALLALGLWCVRRGVARIAPR